MYHVYDKDGNEIGTATTYAAAYSIAKDKGGGKIDIRWKDTDENKRGFVRI